MAVKHRCGFCRKVLRADKTCGNKKCPRYVPEKTEVEEQPKQEETPVEQPKPDSATVTNVGGK